jgi:hypothetical protein
MTSYINLTLGRYGRMAVKPVLINGGQLENGKLVSAFRQQVRMFATEDLLQPAYERIIKEADGRYLETPATHHGLPVDNEAKILGMPFDDDEAEAAERLAATHGEDPKFETLVALLPYRRFVSNVEGLSWTVRARPSMTSCTLQVGSRQTKLWWTFEGIPGGGTSPSECQAAAFVKATSTWEKIAAEVFTAAYVKSLEAFVGKVRNFDDGGERISIAMSDNDARPVAELLGALSSGPLSKIETDPGLEGARVGLSELRTFIGGFTEKLQVNQDTVSLATEVPGITGVVCRREAIEQSPETLLAGFAQRAGNSGGFNTRRETSISFEHEEYVRAISAARPLSASLTNIEARRLEKRFGLH